jgi:hypothetical protein
LIAKAEQMDERLLRLYSNLIRGREWKMPKVEHQIIPGGF